MFCMYALFYFFRKRFIFINITIDKKLFYFIQEKYKKNEVKTIISLKLTWKTVKYYNLNIS